MVDVEFKLHMLDGKYRDFKGKLFSYSIDDHKFSFVLHPSWDVVGSYTISHLGSGRAVLNDFPLEQRVLDGEDLELRLVQKLAAYIAFTGKERVLKHLLVASEHPAP